MKELESMDSERTLGTEKADFAQTNSGKLYRVLKA
jgi:hypothetical protein